MNDTSKVDIASLFPTPLAKVLIPPELSVACNFLDKTPMLHDKESKGEYGVHSENTYIMDEPECAELKNYILKLVTDFGRNILMYGYEEYVFSQTWVSWKEPGQFHTAHTHPNSVISAVFFYGYAEEGTPALMFHKQSGGLSTQSMMLKKRMLKKNEELSPYAWETFTIPFKPGLLLIFPSYFMHSVPPNRTNDTRKSVSMNIVPKGAIGDEHSLTELRYDKVLGK